MRNPLKKSIRSRAIICSILLSFILNPLTSATTSFAGEMNILGGKISWQDKMYISDGCSRYDFSYSNESGNRLLQLGFELNDPNGRNLIFNSQVGIESNKSGTWSMQICSKQFTNGFGPYLIKGIVKEYGSNQRQETREIYFLPLPGTPTIKAGAKCTDVKSTIVSLGMKYTCIRSGNKLIWSKGVKVSASKPSPTPTTKPSGASQAGKSSEPVSEFKVGSKGPGGGIIFYYKSTGFKCGPTLSETCKYLEAAPEFHKLEAFDYERFQSCQYKYFYSLNWVEPLETGNEIGAGSRNSALISSQKNQITGFEQNEMTGFNQKGQYSLISQNYRGPNGLTDWYVPSRDELKEMYLQRNLLKNSVSTTASYWSSSDAGGGYFAYGYDFKNNAEFGDQKSVRYCVHLIRAF